MSQVILKFGSVFDGNSSTVGWGITVWLAGLLKLIMLGGA